MDFPPRLYHSILISSDLFGPCIAAGVQTPLPAWYTFSLSCLEVSEVAFSAAAACLAAAAMLSGIASERPTVSVTDLEGQTGSEL